MGMSPSGKPFEKHLLEPILKKHSFANFREPILETILCGKPFWNQETRKSGINPESKKNNILGMPKNMESSPESIQKAKKINIGEMWKQSRNKPKSINFKLLKKRPLAGEAIMGFG